jgi:hypothetical protein
MVPVLNSAPDNQATICRANQVGQIRALPLGQFLCSTKVLTAPTSRNPRLCVNVPLRWRRTAKKRFFVLV